METAREVIFCVDCTTNQGEQVAVVGNCPALGDWKHDQPLMLQRAPEYESETHNEVWSGTCALPVHRDIHFRYFVCVLVDSPGDSHSKLPVVRRWETNIIPRKIRRPANDKEASSVVKRGIDVFGVYDGANSPVAVEQGWLTYETVVQFKIANDPIHFWRKKYKGKPIRLKMVAVNLSRQNSVTDCPESMEYQDSSSGIEVSHSGWPIVEVAVINESDHQFAMQEQFGKLLKSEEMMIFQAQVFQLHTVGYMIDFYTDNNEDIPQHIGFCHIVPNNFREAIGSITIPITSLRQEPIGQINVEYLVVKPLPDFSCDMKVSYSRYWKHHWKGLDIGHRGSGNSVRSFQSCANIRENTIASLQKAADHGADFVEFDVQLSKDYVPVLFHDFHVNIGLQQKAKRGGEMTTLKIPVKDLTFKQLHELKVHLLDWDNFEPFFSGMGKKYHKKVSHVEDEPHMEDEEDDSHDPFPTLKHALEVLPTDVGFNIEVKWTMETKDGSWELENPFELNSYLDIVLKTVLENACERRIVFSCFHPDICTMIRLKQNKYPVLFLTQGVTSKYPEYKDARTRNISVAVAYALHAGILGLNIHTEDLLRDPSQIKEVIDNGLVAFCWGDDNNNPSTIRFLKQMGMHGVIYDRISDHMPEKKSIFFTDHQYELLKIAATSPEAQFQQDQQQESRSESDSDTPLHESPSPNFSRFIHLTNGSHFSNGSNKS